MCKRQAAPHSAQNRISRRKEAWQMIVNAFTCSGAYAVLIMSGLKRVENRSMMPVPARGVAR